MSQTSRRRFLGTVGAGAAAAGVAVVPGAAHAAPARSGRRATEPVVAYIENVGSGRLTLMVGEREVEVEDRDLVNRILDAAGE